jgi:hypothetical protein
MRYVDDDGRLNNFAIEPKMYQADPATGVQKRNLAIIGVVGAVLVVGLVVVAASIS